jgi:hypothetical protein
MTIIAKTALDYLKASGATAICIVDLEGSCTFRIGHKIDPDAVVIEWLPEIVAASIVKQAKREAGKHPDAAAATAALHRPPQTTASR